MLVTAGCAARETPGERGERGESCRCRKGDLLQVMSEGGGIQEGREVEREGERKRKEVGRATRERDQRKKR